MQEKKVKEMYNPQSVKEELAKRGTEDKKEEIVNSMMEFLDLCLKNTEYTSGFSVGMQIGIGKLGASFDVWVCDYSIGEVYREFIVTDTIIEDPDEGDIVIDQEHELRKLEKLKACVRAACIKEE